MSNSISIELPSNWYNSKWIGFALWASVYLSSSVELELCVIKAHVIALGDMPQNHWTFELFTTLIRHKNGTCLLYLSRDDWFAIAGKGICNQIKVTFETDRSTTGNDVFNCGVSLLYEQDVDKFNQTNAQSSIESFVEEVSIYKLTSNDHLNHASLFFFLFFFFFFFGSPWASNSNHPILSEFLKIKLKLLLLLLLSY